MNELKAYEKLNKCTEELEETKEMVNSLNTKIKEAKESQETLKSQLTKKEESCHMLGLEIINLKRIQLENKEEIKRLNIEVVDLTKEMNELKACDKLNKCTKELEETKEISNNLNTQLEEAKESEEILKIQLAKKEKSFQKL